MDVKPIALLITMGKYRGVAKRLAEHPLSSQTCSMLRRKSLRSPLYSAAPDLLNLDAVDGCPGAIANRAVSPRDLSSDRPETRRLLGSHGSR